MIRIRTKLLVFFIVLVVIVNSVAFFLYNSSEKIIEEYNSSFQRFLLLNEISQQTNSFIESVNGYIVEKDDKFKKEYELKKKGLTDNKKRLDNGMKNSHNYVALLNYEHMIDSLIEESDMTIRAFEASDIHSYSRHFNEASEISAFIQESTLDLIDKELSSHQVFFELLTKRNIYYQFTALSLFSGTLIISALLAIRLSGGITRPIRELSAAAKEISSGNLTGKDVIASSKDEMKLLTETFNHMRKNIVELVHEIKEKSELDKLLKEMELKSLQNQINPHFLFNTLNNVSRMAYLEDAYETTKLVEAISALLRYNLANIDQPSTLKDETEVVKDYFFIQQTRFGDRISFITNIEDSCLQTPIPRMTLQPIVENAFIHGVEANEQEGLIKLSIYKCDQKIVVEIIDNGKGMSKETKAKLLSYVHDQDYKKSTKPLIISGHSTGIGVKNVIKRLQIFYRTANVIEIESEQGYGTTFRIIIPIVKGGEANADHYSR